MPTLSNPQDLNNKLWSNLKLAIAADNLIDDDQTTQIPQARKWTNLLTQDFIQSNFNSNTKLLGNVSTVAAEHS